MPERHGELFTVLARGALNSCMIRFESDGQIVITSRNALRKAGGPMIEETAMTSEPRQQPALPIELDLIESTNQHGRPFLAGQVNGTKVRVWLHRVQRDEVTGRTRRLWKMIVEPAGRTPPPEKPLRRRGGFRSV